MNVSAQCPVCEDSVDIEDPGIDDETDCPVCEAELIVVSVDPLRFAELEDEDDDDVEDDEFDDDTEDEDEEPY